MLVILWTSSHSQGGLWKRHQSHHHRQHQHAGLGDETLCGSGQSALQELKKKLNWNNIRKIFKSTENYVCFFLKKIIFRPKLIWKDWRKCWLDPRPWNMDTRCCSKSRIRGGRTNPENWNGEKKHKKSYEKLLTSGSRIGSSSLF